MVYSPASSTPEGAGVGAGVVVDTLGADAVVVPDLSDIRVDRGSVVKAPIISLHRHAISSLDLLVTG